ncbi:MAG TPA: thiamine diphosphokinase [Candidatus Cloacimonadota bacterium]|nr:thiamine diphosphokinase [Candidatus Cloacimonadota bacterium]HQL15099.1 thiamine diphosphokinase [Candidatus Cloacimonadota bacterium]
MIASFCARLITPFAPLKPAVPYSSFSDEDLVIAVDGGYQMCRKLSIKPAVLIGDFDSLNPEEKEQIEAAEIKVLPHSQHKNETDTELAVQYCLQNSIKEVYIYNTLDGRFDHALALVQNLLEAHRANINCRIVSSSQIVFLLAETTKTDFPTGTILSLLAISPSATFISSLGLFYPLDELTLFNWQSRGISNSVTEPEQIITLKNGTALAVVTLQDANQPKS